MAQRCVVFRSSSSLARSVFCSHASRRCFFGGPGSASTPLTLQASRTLPYPADSLYGLISDISQYPHFIPYCNAAKVLDYSLPDPSTGQKWPAHATLTIGYGGFQEEFLSKVYCVPNHIVEAISGEALSSLDRSEVSHYEGLEIHGRSSTQNELFTSLRTRWSLRPWPFKPAHKHPDVQSGKAHPSEVSVESKGHPDQGKPAMPSEPRTDVDLVIEVDWKNPIYAAASNALAPSVANKIVEAFENRAREVLGSPGAR